MHKDRRRRTVRGPARGIVRGMAVATAVAAAVTGMSMQAAGPAGAGGGDVLYPARDRYEPGQTVTMIGYGYGYGDPQATWRTTQFHGYLLAAADLEQAFPPVPGMRMGPVVVQEVAPFQGRDLRVGIEFALPAELPPGEYLLDICDDPCVTRLAYFMPSSVHVGVDPSYQVVRDWPLTDPAIRWLEPDALLAGPTFEPVTVADVRAGRVPTAPPPAAAPMPVPEAAAPASRPAAPVRPSGVSDGAERDGDTSAVTGETVRATAAPTDDRPSPGAGWGAAALALGLVAVAIVIRRARIRARTRTGYRPAGTDAGADADIDLGSGGAVDPAPEADADPARHRARVRL